MPFLQRLFGETKEREALQPLYRSLVRIGRDPAWYRDGQVPDSLDGRFAMVAAITALALLRLESEGEDGRRLSVLLTEIFIEDMDGTLRQIGIGDYVVGKHVGRMVGALGGRLEAFREASESGDFEQATARNVFAGTPPSPEALAFVSDRLRAINEILGETKHADLLEGRIGSP